MNKEMKSWLLVICAVLALSACGQKAVVRIVGQPTISEQLGLIPVEAIPIYIITPKAPKAAVDSCLDGQVTVEFAVNDDGVAEDIEVVSSDPPRVFERSVLSVLPQWRFRPNIPRDKPVRFYHVFKFDSACKKAMTMELEIIEE